MKTILLVSSKDNNFYNFRSELICNLKNNGYDVVLVCPYGKKIDYFLDKGCRFVDIPMDRRGTNVFNDLKLIVNYFKVIHRINPDIVLTYTTKCSVYMGIVCSFKAIPYIINNAGLIVTKEKSLLNSILNILYRLGFSHANCMMYQNTMERDYLNSILHNKVNFLDIPGSGVNLKQFSFSEYPNDKNILIFNYVARIVQFKGIDEYLECACYIKSKYPNTIFRIFGDYDDLAYKERISKLEKQAVVEYKGNVLDMRPYIIQANAVIHPSHYEGMTNVVLEHSAMGRPCLGSNIPGVREGIEDGVSGFLFEVNNVQSMIQSVEKFINLTYLQKKDMGIAARIKMEKEFDREIVTRLYESKIIETLK